MSRTLAALLAATVCVGTAVAQTPSAALADAPPLTLAEALAAARAQLILAPDGCLRQKTTCKKEGCNPEQCVFCHMRRSLPASRRQAKRHAAHNCPLSAQVIVHLMQKPHILTDN